MVMLLHHFLRQIFRRVHPATEDDFDSLEIFECLGKEFLTNEQFMVKVSFEDSVLTVVERQVDVERSQKKTVGSRGVAATLVSETYTHFVDACRVFIRQMCLGLLLHDTWKSDLVIGFARFDSAVLFCLPKSQSLDRFKQLFKSFGDRGWDNKDMRSRFKDCYMSLWTTCGMGVLRIVERCLKWKA